MSRPAGSRVLVSTRIAAVPERVFEAFTAEIDRWWQLSPLFRLTRGRRGAARRSAIGGRSLTRSDN